MNHADPTAISGYPLFLGFATTLGIPAPGYTGGGLGDGRTASGFLLSIDPSPTLRPFGLGDGFGSGRLRDGFRTAIGPLPDRRCRRGLVVGRGGRSPRGFRFGGGPPHRTPTVSGGIRVRGSGRRDFGFRKPPGPLPPARPEGSADLVFQ